MPSFAFLGLGLTIGVITSPLIVLGPATGTYMLVRRDMYDWKIAALLLVSGAVPILAIVLGLNLGLL